jgi:hypothetical protein
VKHQRDVDGHLRLQADRRTPRCNPGVVDRTMQKLVANESVQLGAFPRLGDQQRVHTRERLDAAREALLELGRVAGTA